jgi:LysM repeat protein
VDPLRPPPPEAVLPVGNQLAKALIINTSTGDAFPVMYNPEELTLEQGNAFAEIDIPGLDAPPTQYIRGKTRALTMELLFDTYEDRVDVRRHTAPIVGLLDKQPRTNAPPVLLFSMGRLQFRCVLVDAKQRFTMFLRDGTPVRSTLSVRLQEYVEVDIEIGRGLFFGSPTISAGVTAVVGELGATAVAHVVGQGDTLSGLAAAYLGDAARWREIADANAVEDPFDLPPGRALVIPSPGGRRRPGGRT